MDLDRIRAHGLRKPGTTEDLPFGPETLALKVMGKLFALIALDDVPNRINLKVQPEQAQALRDAYPENVLPGYHMNKRHWNTVVLDGALPPQLVLGWLDDSYALVCAGLKKADREALQTEEAS